MRRLPSGFDAPAVRRLAAGSVAVPLVSIRETSAASSATPTGPSTTRWLYWEARHEAAGREASRVQGRICSPGNLWLISAAETDVRQWTQTEPQAYLLATLAVASPDRSWCVSMFPAWLNEEALGTPTCRTRVDPNLSAPARRYLEHCRLDCRGPLPPRASGAARALTTGNRMRALCGWSGRGFRCRTGPNCQPAPAQRENDVAAKASRGFRDPGRLGCSRAGTSRVTGSRDVRFPVSPQASFGLRSAAKLP